MEKRFVVTVNIPGAFMQSDIDELIHIKFGRNIALLLLKVDPTYKQFLTHEQGKLVIYAKLSKALYCTLQGALLFCENISLDLYPTK